MTEYWISKKQYWCKYCNIFIRDDAPSRKQHETGLKHQGNKERFIRDLYKVGSNAKHEKARADAEMARIESAAEAAYAKDTHLPSSRPAPSRMHPSAGASNSKGREASKPKDKWANYTSAKDMGFHDEETQKSTYEIEQELKGRAAAAIGAWEEVVETPPQATWSEEGGEGYKRKLGEYMVDDNMAEGEGFKFAHRDKRPVRDPYDDDDWDPKAALGKIKFKSKSSGAKREDEVKAEAEAAGGLDREKWTGKLEMKTGSSPQKSTRPDGLVYINNGWNKVDDVEADPAEDPAAEEDVKPDVKVEEIQRSLGEDAPTDATAPSSDGDAPHTKIALSDDIKPDIEHSAATSSTQDVEAAAPASSATNLFKKRRPPPSNRKK